MKNKHIFDIFMDIFADIAGSTLIAMGVYNFAASSNFPVAGVSGIALILYKLFRLPIGTLSLLLNVPIALCTFRILGRRFFVHSVRTTVILSLIMDYIVPQFPIYQGDRMLSALCFSVLSGIGYAMIYMRDSSTGGVDFIIHAVRAKHPHFSVGKITFCIDIFVISLGVLLVTRDIDSLIFGVLTTYLLTVVIDKIMYGTDQGKFALIVTDRGPEICHEIDSRFHRGSTILSGIGGYSLQKRDIVMCACNNKQMYGIRKRIKQIDPSSFLIIMESNEVVGEGFKGE